MVWDGQPYSIQGRVGAIVSPMPRRTSKKDSPRQARRSDEAPLARRPIAHRREILGTVEAPDVASAKAAAAIQFDLDEIQRGRIMVQELG